MSRACHACHHYAEPDKAGDVYSVCLLSAVRQRMRVSDFCSRWQDGAKDEGPRRAKPVLSEAEIMREFETMGRWLGPKAAPERITGQR